LRYGFETTVQTMHEEMQENRQGSGFVQDEQQAIQYMGQAFNTGKREAFFTLWHRSVPAHIRQNDLICMKLEFYLHIYFAVYPSFMA
jgi:hypothetical protein